ncbi:MAG: LexA family protein [Armatimonadota bacterium]
MLPMESFSDAFKRVRARSGRSQAVVADALGVSRATVNKWEHGGDTDNETKKRIAQFFKVPVEQLLGIDLDRRLPSEAQLAASSGAEVYPVSGPIVQLPIYGEIAAGTATIAEQRPEGFAMVDTSLIPAIKADIDKYYWLKITGDSMQDAGYRKGGLALIHCQDTFEDGDVAVVMVDGESATLKQVLHAGEHIILVPANGSLKPEKLPARDVRVIGVAIASFNF